MASVMIVDADRLGETPRAFQQYVEHFFRESTCLGKRVFVATRVLRLDPRKHVRGGFAPRHSIELDGYTEGLNGVSLGAWIFKAHGTFLWEFEGGHDSDNVVHMD